MALTTLHKRKYYDIDPRFRFIIGFLFSFVLISIENERALLLSFILGLFYCLYCGKWKNAIGFILAYILLQYWAYKLLMQDEVSGMITGVIMFRRLMLIGVFITPLASVEIGALVAAMYKLKLPRMFIISIAIIFRFLPTIKEEYIAVRNSQKFRGIGRSIINVILHPVIFYETLLVPLTIRIMKISDELSASAMLRGADRKGNGTCYRDLKITALDCLILLFMLTSMSLIVLYNYNISISEVIAWLS